MFKQLTLAGIACLTLAACGGSQSSSSTQVNRANFLVPVAETNGSTFIDLRLVPFQGAGGGYSRIDVKLGGRNASHSKRGKTMMSASPYLTNGVAETFRSGVDNGTMMALSQQAVMAAGYCPSGALRPNNGITRYSNPNDIDAILNASRTAGRDVIPSSARGTSVPAVRRGNSGWEVSMLCG